MLREFDQYSDDYEKFRDRSTSNYRSCGCSFEHYFHALKNGAGRSGFCEVEHVFAASYENVMAWMSGAAAANCCELGKPYFQAALLAVTRPAGMIVPGWTEHRNAASSLAHWNSIRFTGIRPGDRSVRLSSRPPVKNAWRADCRNPSRARNPERNARR